MILQLNPPIPVITPKGEGIAHFLIDYGIEDNLYWVVFIHETGECWTYDNPQIRACKNITLGRLDHPKIDGIKITSNAANTIYTKPSC